MTPILNSPPVNEHDAAQELNIPVSTLRKWRVLRQGPDFIKMGRLVRYEREALARFKAQNTRRMPPATAA